MKLTVEKRFNDRALLAEQLAAKVAGQLQEAIDARGKASLVVSGGRTPLAFFQALSRQPITWSKVLVTLADERWVDLDDSASNAALVRQHLITGRAASARFVGLKTPHATVEAGLALASDWLGALPQPLDVVILGMGNDGHTASLFPDCPHLQEGLQTQARLIAAHPASQPLARISMSLSALLNSRQIYLHLEGQDKADTLAKALAGGDVAAMPIRAILGQKQTPVDVYLYQEEA
ncbi:6-phosphogluconolactonase [Gallaecimonas xiamenensis]|uniref:6-phosphogluconolactonase n=1 Tax=Gallaecimonas xiamenensis 3-C-1 TaxID=745411 RepID=K2J141_9GAMM|nr:6-phosphogluconolactonase [Gallaecimonas xiamenensis]EKE76626.1 6-phosphogluconolactonase [Gallaecimonas xiamenensis 3-C-1]